MTERSSQGPVDSFFKAFDDLEEYCNSAVEGKYRLAGHKFVEAGISLAGGNKEGFRIEGNAARALEQDAKQLEERLKQLRPFREAIHTFLINNDLFHPEETENKGEPAQKPEGGQEDPKLELSWEACGEALEKAFEGEDSEVNESPKPIQRIYQKKLYEVLFPYDEKADLHIEDLNLGTFTYSRLGRADLTHVGQILELSEDDLLSIKHFGNKSLEEVINRLKVRGFLREVNP